MLFMYKTTIFAQKNASWNALYVERGLLHLNINIVSSNFVVSGGPGPYRSPGP